MSYAHEHRLPPEVVAELARAKPARGRHLVWPGVTALLALLAVLMLLVPAEFNETVERPGGVRLSVSLECGSVVSPHTEPTDGGLTGYRDQCTARRTQRAGQAGLALAGALVATAAGLALQRRRPGARANEASTPT